MSDLLERGYHTSSREETRRLALTIAALLITSAIWHMARPGVIRVVSRATLGGPVDGYVVAAALRQKFPDLPPPEELFSRWALFGSWRPEPGWITWEQPAGYEESSDGAGDWTLKQRVFYADHRFHVRGYVVYPGLSLNAPSDRDGDGRWEVLLHFRGPSRIAAGAWTAERYLVVRLGPARNHIVWAGLIRHRPGTGLTPRIVPIWQDEDRDGSEELAFVTMEWLSRMRYKPPRTVAVFDWDRPGGILIPRLLSEERERLAWNPMTEGPIVVDPETVLEKIVTELTPYSETPDYWPTTRSAN